jgi:hypothetical protein
MFEFRYKISLSILHPSIDPVKISSVLGGKPKIQRKAGEEVLSTKGVPLGRKSKLSHWLVSLQDGQMVKSDAHPISEIILNAAKEIEPHKQFLKSITDEGGKVEFRIAWFGNSSNSTGVLKAEALQLCGALGIDILLDVYGPEDQPQTDGPTVNDATNAGEMPT